MHRDFFLKKQGYPNTSSYQSLRFWWYAYLATDCSTDAQLFCYAYRPTYCSTEMGLWCYQGQCMRALADYSRALEIEKRTLVSSYARGTKGPVLTYSILLYVWN